MKSVFPRTVLVLASFAAMLTAGPAWAAEPAEKGRASEAVPELTQEQVDAVFDRCLDDIRHCRERGLILIQFGPDMTIAVPRATVVAAATRRILGGEDPAKVTNELRLLMGRQRRLRDRAEDDIARAMGDDQRRAYARNIIRILLDVVNAGVITPGEVFSLSITEASVEPAEVEPGKSARLRAVYWAKRIANTGVTIQEKITVTGPGTPPVVRSTERALTETQHGDGVAGTMDGACRPESEIVATTPGKYTCLIEISVSGKQAVARTVSFTVKGPAAPGGATIVPGSGKAVWRRGAAQLDPRVNFDRPNIYEGVNCGFDRQNLTATSYSAAQRRTGKEGTIYRDITWNIQFGSPPSELRAGQVIELTVSGTAGGTPWDDFFNWRGGDWKIDQGQWDLVHTTSVAPGLPRGFGIGKYGATIEIRQAEARFRLTVPDNPSDKFSVYFSMPNVGSAVYTYEKKGDAAGPAVGGAEQGNPDGGVVAPRPPVIRNLGGDGGGRIARPGEEGQGGTMRGGERPTDPNSPGRTERVTNDVSGRTGRPLENARAIQRVFAVESAWLGGYPDAGSNSTNPQDHLRWTEDRSDEQIAQTLIDKFLAQFDRQAAKGRETACQFYATVSARLAHYGANLGDQGSNLKDPESHLRWAQGQSTAKQREAIAEKLRALLRGL